MSTVSWEVYIGSWLQEKQRTGPLKKATCGPDYWCAFCVHDNRIPLLERYKDEQRVITHKPLKVVDLLECAYVSASVEDDRTFVIGFKDTKRSIVEMAALTSSERDNWISMLKFKLTELDCLDSNKNLYSQIPDFSVSCNVITNDVHGRLSDLFPQSPSPVYTRTPTLPARLPSSNVSLNSNIPVPFVSEMNRSTSVPAEYETLSNFRSDLPININNNNIYEHISQGLRLNSTSVDHSSSSAESSSEERAFNSNVLSQSPNEPVSTLPIRSISQMKQRALPPPPLPPRGPNNVTSRRFSAEEAGTSAIYDVPSPRQLQEMTSLYDCPSPRTVIPTENTVSEVKDARSEQTSKEIGPEISNIRPPCSTCPDLYENVIPTPKSPIMLNCDEYSDRYHTPGKPRPVTEADLVAALPVLPPRPKTRNNHNLDSPVPLSDAPPPFVAPVAPDDADTVGPLVSPGLPPRYVSASRYSAADRPESRASTISVGSIASNCGTRMSLKEREITKLRDEMDCDSMTVGATIRDAVDGLALVQFDKALWVAGWNKKCHLRLSAAFHVGDKILAVNDFPVSSLDHAETAFYSTTPGCDVQFSIQRLPHARVFALKRLLEKQELGIQRDRGKNTISDIVHGSIAHEAGLTPGGPSYADSNRLTPWVITEVNGRPLSIFSKNDEAAHRLKAIGLDLTLVVQAKDFVKLLKTQLKNKKNWKYFVM